MAAHLKQALAPIIRSNLYYLRFQNAVAFPHSPTSFIPLRGVKFYKLKWRVLRAKKVKKVDLPDWNVVLNQGPQKSMEEMKSELKKKGIIPPRRYDNKPVYLQASSGIFEAYVPPEGDGKANLLTVGAAKEKYDIAAMKTKSLNAVRKLKKYEEAFKARVFAEEAIDLYKNAHIALCDWDDDALHKYVTEQAYPEMIFEAQWKTFRWQFLQNLEPPRVVHVRTVDMLGVDNVFAQVTVRIHSKQTLAVYDRFGRLMHGSETLPKDVLEYVVFEKHLSNEHGCWRVHGKIVPDWMPLPDPSFKTTRLEKDAEDANKEDTPQAIDVTLVTNV